MSVYDRISALEMAIATQVMQGRIDLARDYATDLALVRDSVPTYDETTAVLQARFA